MHGRQTPWGAQVDYVLGDIDDADPPYSSVTAITTARRWVDDDEPIRQFADLACVLRFELVNGAAVLTDVHVAYADRPIAIGRSTRDGRPWGIERELPPGSGFTYTTGAMVSLDAQLGRPRPPGGITVRLLRELPLATIEREARRQMLGRQFIDAGLVWTPQHHRRPGRRGHDDGHYAELVARYLAIHATGSATPTADLALELSISASQVRAKLGEAARRGLYRSNGRGRAGGTITAKGTAALSTYMP